MNSPFLQYRYKVEFPAFLLLKKEVSDMKKTRYTEEQIAFTLKQAETGVLTES